MTRATLKVVYYCLFYVGEVRCTFVINSEQKISKDEGGGTRVQVFKKRNGNNDEKIRVDEER